MSQSSHNGNGNGAGTAQRVPDWLLERLARDELPAGQAAEVRARLQAEGEAGAARLAALALSDQEILAQHPPAEVAAEVRRRLARLEAAAPVQARAAATRPRWSFALPTLTLGAAGLAALLLVVRPGAGPLDRPGETGEATLQPAPHEAEQTRSKGFKPQMSVWRKRGNEADRLSAQTPVRAGDVLQLKYVAGRRSHGVLASIDARGVVTLHLPQAAGGAAPLSQEGETALPSAYQLDDSPGFERFVFVSGDRPFATGLVVEALRSGAELPSDLTLVDLTLRKENP